MSTPESAVPREAIAQSFADECASLKNTSEKMSDDTMFDLYHRAEKALGSEDLRGNEPKDQDETYERMEYPYMVVRLGHDMNLLQTMDGISVESDEEIDRIKTKELGI